MINNLSNSLFLLMFFTFVRPVFSQNLKINIKQNDKILATLQAGSFIGEISFMSGSKASANVSASEETKVISWDQMGLRKLLLANPCLHLIFSEIINKDLSQKLSTKQ